MRPPTEQLGNQLMKQHRYQAALEAYQRVPVRSAKLWSSMGIAYQLLSDFNDSVRCYKESGSELDPQNALFGNSWKCSCSAQLVRIAKSENKVFQF